MELQLVGRRRERIKGLMKRVSILDLENLASKLGLKIQHDCGGYRVVSAGQNNSNQYIFPSTGICPTATKAQCAIFLEGVMYQRKQEEQKQKYDNTSTLG